MVLLKSRVLTEFLKIIILHNYIGIRFGTDLKHNKIYIENLKFPYPQTIFQPLIYCEIMIYFKNINNICINKLYPALFVYQKALIRTFHSSFLTAKEPL